MLFVFFVLFSFVLVFFPFSLACSPSRAHRRYRYDAPPRSSGVPLDSFCFVLFRPLSGRTSLTNFVNCVSRISIPKSREEANSVCNPHRCLSPDQELIMAASPALSDDEVRQWSERLESVAADFLQRCWDAGELPTHELNTCQSSNISCAP